MTVLIVAMLVSLAVAVVVVGIVAIPARRQGHDLLSDRGEELVHRVRPGRPGSTQGRQQDPAAEPDEDEQPPEQSS